MPGIEERGTEFDLQHDRVGEGGIGRKPRVSFQDPALCPLLTSVQVSGRLLSLLRNICVMFAGFLRSENS